MKLFTEIILIFWVITSFIALVSSVFLLLEGTKYQFAASIAIFLISIINMVHSIYVTNNITN